jgi:alpha-L-fucosidase 2
MRLLTVIWICIVIFFSVVPARVSAEVTFSGSAAAPEHKLSLWYRQPATNWMTSALPIGNGRIGAMVFGSVQQEHLQFNDKTLWTGNTTTRGAYQNFGDLYFDFPGLTAVTDYRRELDLEESAARVRYLVGSTEYTREYFASYPDNVVVMRFAASQPGAVSFTVGVTDAHTGTKTSSADTITISGSLTLLSYEAQVKVINEGGSLSVSSNQITVTNANAVTVLLAAGTNYSPTSTTYTGTAPHAAVTTQISNASAKTYVQLKASQVADYQSLFNRVSLSLDDTKPTIPTNELLASFNAGTFNAALEVLYFQFGRYLMIGSSRGIALPANLQGLWNNSNTPPWECDIHSNINIEMNYWPAETTNLSECHVPFTDYVYNEAMVQTSWSSMASSLSCRGWTMKTQNNIFAYSDWNWNRPANAWYCMHLWQHYLYTLDTAYLSAKAYPVMKKACEFWIDRLITDTDGTLVAPDEWSPEHGNWENGVSYAQQLIWDLFTNTIQASQALDIDADFRSTLQTKLSLLDTGVHIGSWGQIKEWKVSTDSSTDTHRHISHLICLYPGKQISPFMDTSFTNAAKVSLNARGDGGTGWSRAWKICTWARLLDGNHAHTLVKNALRVTTVTTIDMSDGGGVYENLLDAHPPFQIDGNFGGTAGITEMLLQSYLGPIQLLPALPAVWPTGHVTGLRAVNGFEVELSWASSQLTQAVIKSDKGQPCQLRGAFRVSLLDGTPVATTITNNITAFATQTGTSYKVIALIPDVPAGLAAKVISSSRIDLSWSASPDAQYYTVKRANVSGGSYLVIADNLNTNQYSDTGLAGGTTYYYVVSASNAQGHSGDSAEVSAATKNGPPPVPTNLSATPDNAKVWLSWSVSAGAVSYNLKRATTVGGPYLTIASPTANSFTDTSVSNGTSYYYRVSAVKGSLESADSRPMSALPSTTFSNRATGGIPSASADNSAWTINEAVDKAFDGSTSTKWFTGSGTGSTGWLQYSFGTGKKWVVTRYDLSSANDVPARDPKDWQFLGSNDGTNWTVLDTRTGQSWASRYLTKQYSVTTPGPYQYYRLNITANNGNNDIQLSEMALYAYGDMAPSSAPVFLSDPLSKSQAIEDAEYSETLTNDVFDANPSDVLTFSKGTGPAWLTVSSDGVLSGTPADTDTGANVFTIQVSDSGGLNDTATVSIAVANIYSGVQGVTDLLGLAAGWLMQDCSDVPACGGADLDGDADVDLDDFSKLALNWLGGGAL